MLCPTLALSYVMIRNTKFTSGYYWTAGLLDPTHITDLSSVRTSEKALVDAWLWYHPRQILDKPPWGSKLQAVYISMVPGTSSEMD